jgi:hypothetical protein
MKITDIKSIVDLRAWMLERGKSYDALYLRYSDDVVEADYEKYPDYICSLLNKFLEFEVTFGYKYRVSPELVKRENISMKLRQALVFPEWHGSMRRCGPYMEINAEEFSDVG